MCEETLTVQAGNVSKDKDTTFLLVQNLFDFNNEGVQMSIILEGDGFRLFFQFPTQLYNQFEGIDLVAVHILADSRPHHHDVVGPADAPGLNKLTQRNLNRFVPRPFFFCTCFCKRLSRPETEQWQGLPVFIFVIVRTGYCESLVVLKSPNNPGLTHGLNKAVALHLRYYFVL